MTNPTEAATRDSRREWLRARIAALRAALDLLWAQVDRDRGVPYRVIGRAKLELVDLERELYALDCTARAETWAKTLPYPIPAPPPATARFPHH